MFLHLASGLDTIIIGYALVVLPQMHDGVD